MQRTRTLLMKSQEYAANRAGRLPSHEQPVQTHRLEFDIVRGLLIILVVVGHTTNKYGGLIYQFHVASFFILSGFLLPTNRMFNARFVAERVKRLVIPFVTAALCFETLARIMNALTVTPLFATAPFAGILKLNTNPLSGVNWFLMVLFIGTMLTLVTLRLLKLQRWIGLRGLSFFSAAIFLVLAYFQVLKHGPTLWNFDLGVLAAGYICLLGLFFRLSLDDRQSLDPLVLALLTAVFFLFERYYPQNTNWPTRAFGLLTYNLVAVCAGFAMVMAVSKCIFQHGPRLISGGLAFVGRSTVQILILHLFAFKICYSLFYLFGQVSIHQVQALILEEQLWLWPFVVGVGLIFPLLFDQLLKRFPRLRRFAWGL